MKDGFIKVCAVTPEIRVADCLYNADSIINEIKKISEKKAAVAVFPELCISGYSCGDLFFQKQLLDSCDIAVAKIAEATDGIETVVIVGAPVRVGGVLYNCGIVIYNGDILGIVPKTNLPNYGEFYEKRHFSQGKRTTEYISYCGSEVLFGTDILFKAADIEGFALAVEVCEDLWAPSSPSIRHASNGAVIIANLSASDELVGKSDYRTNLIKMQSGKLVSAYIYANAGEGESTTDLVYAGGSMICENGSVSAKANMFETGAVYADIDVQKLIAERQKMACLSADDEYSVVEFDVAEIETSLEKYISKTPFVPSDSQRESRCEEILMIQASGLKKRIQHINCPACVIGISGGLDSTLALLVAVRAFDMIGRDRKDIYAVTMPCFGTTDRTYNNAVSFAKSLGVTFMEVDIKKSVLSHFEDIGQSAEVYDVTYENAQARERTQVLMDIANKAGGIVIGTGDLSELALGWATYNGDHMSMYGVNASVPKTLIRYLVEYEAERTDNEQLKIVLSDILATPVSPELLPPKNGEIAQKTENIVGPYNLHDFFLYYVIRFGFAPRKVLRLAEYAFADEYDREFILSWLKVFYRRFFTQQFKRSCVPDGPKVGMVALSPRGDWRMPSDACVRVWLEELERIEKQ